jgi:hypothetical protein
MYKADTPLLPKLLLVGVASATLAIGASAAVSATTEPPTDTAAAGTAAPPAGGSAAADVSAFCEAEVAAEQAFASEDPAQIGPAVEALTAAAPEDAAPLVEAVLANAENDESPEFAEAYDALIEYMRANCGFAELNVALTDYAFGGIPEEVAAGPTILTAENAGAEVHEIVIARINDDVELTLEEILALPEEESESMVTFLGGIFPVFPETTRSTVLSLEPGRHVAICFFPEGTTPEVFEQMMAAEEAAAGSVPADSAPEGSMPTGTDHAAMDTAPADTATMATGSAPEGSAPAGEEGTPHFMLGMVQEFTVS